MKQLTFTLLVWLALAGATQAEQMQQFGPYQVHYSVVNTSFLSPQVAKAYGIVRADNRVLLNIAIRKVGEGAETSAQQAKLNGTRNDLMRKYPLQFTQIEEQDAVYYISEFRVIDEEFSRFSIDIQVGEQKPFTLTFEKMLYLNK